MTAISVIVEKSAAGEIEKPILTLSLGLEYACPKCHIVIVGKLVTDEFGRPVALFKCPDLECGYVWGRVD